MSDVRELIRTAIEGRGLDLKAVSLQMGRNHAYLHQFLNRGVPKKLDEEDRISLARILGVQESDLKEASKVNAHLIETLPIRKKAAARYPSSGSIGPGQDQLKVLGMGEGGVDGWNLWNGDVVQYINRPDNLVGVPGAYGVFIRGSSMIPRYEPGEIAHIHPGKPVGPGAYVLVQRKAAHEGEPPRAVIKRLVKRTGSKVTLAQLSPAKEFDVPADEIVSIHKIVGSSEG